MSTLEQKEKRKENKDLDNLGESSERSVTELAKACGRESITTKNMEKEVQQQQLKKNRASIMSEIESACSKEKIRTHMPKNLWQGASKVLIRNLNNNSTAVQIVGMIEEARANVMDLCLIKNEETISFSGIVKAALVGNTSLNKWMKERKANLGWTRRPIERKRK